MAFTCRASLAPALTPVGVQSRRRQNGITDICHGASSTLYGMSRTESHWFGMNVVVVGGGGGGGGGGGYGSGWLFTTVREVLTQSPGYYARVSTFLVSLLLLLLLLLVVVVVVVVVFVGCLTSQQQASVSKGQICSDNFSCCHTEIEVADQTFYLTQYTDTRPTSPSTDPIMPEREA